MLTLRLAFPWGRYYAHPWGQNPARLSEAEWPPSPWRILRAIAAAWFQANPGKPASPELVEALEVLGRELPEFVLPKVSFANAVHYQPNCGATSKEDVALAKYKRVRHENHFVAVGGDVLVQWQLDVVPDEARHKTRTLLEALAPCVSYFGRAESVCELSVDDLGTLAVRDACAQVVLHGGEPGRRMDSACRDAFCPNPKDFRATDLWRRRENGTGDERAEKHLVQELIDAPQPMPDGAAWYSYRMPEGWPERWVIRSPRPAKRRTKTSRIVAHFLEFSLQCRIPVPVKYTVSIAEMFRDAAIRIHKEPSFALSGHDRPEGLEGNHLHAFFLPQPTEDGKHLSLLRVWCAHGFTQREVNALMSVGSLRWAGGRFPLRPVLLHLIRDLPKPRRSRVWRSLTPFVPPRHWYRKRFAEGRVREPDSPENQLRASLVENGVVASTGSIRRLQAASTGWDVCKVHLPKQARATNAEPDHRIGLFLDACFAERTVLPLPGFGHSSHFGLGQFSSAEEENGTRRKARASTVLGDNESET